jgi:hypothetical protein
VVRVDRAWFEEVRRRDGPDASALQFPAFSTERRFVLEGPQLGQRSAGVDAARAPACAPRSRSPQTSQNSPVAVE